MVARSFEDWTEKQAVFRSRPVQTKHFFWHKGRCQKAFRAMLRDPWATYRSHNCLHSNEHCNELASHPGVDLHPYAAGTAVSPDPEKDKAVKKMKWIKALLNAEDLKSLIQLLKKSFSFAFYQVKHDLMIYNHTKCWQKMIYRWTILRQTLMVAYESFQLKNLIISSVAPLASGFLLVSEMVPLVWPISLSWPWDATPFFMRGAPSNTDFAALQRITAAGWSSSLHSERGGLPTPCQGRGALIGGSSIV